MNEKTPDETRTSASGPRCRSCPNRQARSLLPVFSLTLMFWTACKVGPNYSAPKVGVPVAWSEAPEDPTPPATPAEQGLARWWERFNDPVLTSLVDRAVESNLDVKLAEARIHQARAARREAAAGLGPTLNTTSSIRHSGLSRGNSGGTGSGGSLSTNQYQTGFDAGWELDLFGGVRRAKEAAGADLQAAVEARRDVLVTLTAEVARSYADLRILQQQIVIAQENLKAQQHSAELTRRRFEAGFNSGLDVANAEAQVASTSAQIPILEESVRQSIFAISVLLGQEPGAQVQELSPVSGIPAAPPSVPVGVPSDLLRRRPDIREAEASIHAATARIGVATADLFPQISIPASLGFQSGSIGSWFAWLSHLWSLGPSASVRIFDSGQARSNIEVQKAAEEQALVSYRQTVLNALQEVESALVASTKEQEHHKALAQAVDANKRAVRLATELYVQGQTDFLNVLAAQRSLYGSEDALVQSTGTVTTNLIALYKALGGGW